MMRKKIANMYSISLLLPVIALIMLMSSCEEDVVESVLVVKGSQTLTELLKELQPAFEKQTGIKLKLVGGGTDRGIAALIDGSTDIVLTSRNFTNRELEELRRQNISKSLEFELLARDYICFITNTLNRKDVISENLEQPYESTRLYWNNLQTIFRGRMKNWAFEPTFEEETDDYVDTNQPGFTLDHPINYAGASSARGTYFIVNNLLLQRSGFGKKYVWFGTDEEIIDYVNNHKYGIGYISSTKLVTRKDKEMMVKHVQIVADQTLSSDFDPENLLSRELQIIFIRNYTPNQETELLELVDDQPVADSDQPTLSPEAKQFREFLRSKEAAAIMQQKTQQIMEKGGYLEWLAYTASDSQ